MIRELWSYRELAFFLAWRDVKVRYTQTVFGVLWAVIQPFMTMVVFTLLFGQLAKISTNGIPGPVFYFSALVPWTYFSATVSRGGMSLVSNNALLTKIYFPRMILPAGISLANLVDFMIGSVFLLGFIVYYNVPIGPHLMLWPLLVVLLMLLAFGISAFVAAVNVKYRDVQHALPFVVQLLMFFSPIIYPSNLIPERFQWLLALNPLTGIIEGFRYVMAPDRPYDWTLLQVAVVVTLAIFVGGVAYFRRADREFADVI
jgi:lipopolysaccharide transport system permease protein